MKKLLIILCLSLMIFGCDKDTTNDKNKVNYSEKPELDYLTLMRENEHIILDVRTKEEYDEEHIVGAINIPIDKLTGEEFDKSKIIFVYCRSGNRSTAAYNLLSASGYEVYNLGGIDSIKLSKE